MREATVGNTTEGVVAVEALRTSPGSSPSMPSPRAPRYDERSGCSHLRARGTRPTRPDSPSRRRPRPSARPACRRSGGRGCGGCDPRSSRRSRSGARRSATSASLSSGLMPKYDSERVGLAGSHGWWWPKTSTGRSAPAASSSSHASCVALTRPASWPGITVSSTASSTPGSSTTKGARSDAIVVVTIASWFPRTWCMREPRVS